MELVKVMRLFLLRAPKEHGRGQDEAPTYASYEISKSEPLVKVFDEAHREAFGIAH